MVPINDAIIVAVAQLVDDAQTERRDPSHADLEFQIRRVGLADGDPKSQGQNVGKAKRVRSTLSWALEHNPTAGSSLVSNLLELIRGHGGFRNASPNYVGEHSIENAIGVFGSEGYELSLDGELRPKLLDNLSGKDLTEAIEAYVRRAKGTQDAALVAGTGKDLLEAVAAHILQQRYGSVNISNTNFPNLLGQAFTALNLATPQMPTEDITGPLDRQVTEACGFVSRNQRVRAKKTVGRVDQPQYDLTAVFEAIVNAVAHRDNSMHGSRIRLHMFNNRIELCSPGNLPNTMTVDDLAYRQSSRNETLTNLLARCPVPTGVPGLDSQRTTLMDRRGNGVPIILERSERLSGVQPLYELLGDAELRLTIFAADNDSGDSPVATS